MVGDLGIIFNIVGAVSATGIAYVLPAIFYIKLAKKKTSHYYASWVILIISFSMGGFTLVSEFLFKIKENEWMNEF